MMLVPLRCAALTFKAKTAEAEAMSTDEVRAEEERLAALERSRTGVLSDITAIAETSKNLETRLEQIQEEGLLLQERQAALLAQRKDVVPKIKNALSLYGSVSNIHWDFSAPQELIKGRSCPGSPAGRV